MGGGGLPGSYLTNYLSVDRVSCQICRIVVASLKQNIFLYVKFILRELLQIYSIKFRFFNEYFCFCYLKNSSCTLNRRWWREGGRGENFFLTMACGVKGWGGQMIVKSCVSAKKSFSRLGFFLHERGSISVGTMKPRLDLKYSKVHNGSHRGAIP